LAVLLSALPETGVVEISLFYVDDALGLKGHAASTFNGIFFASFGFSGLLV